MEAAGPRDPPPPPPLVPRDLDRALVPGFAADGAFDVVVVDFGWLTVFFPILVFVVLDAVVAVFDVVLCAALFMAEFAAVPLVVALPSTNDGRPFGPLYGPSPFKR